MCTSFGGVVYAKWEKHVLFFNMFDFSTCWTSEILFQHLEIFFGALKSPKKWAGGSILYDI